MNKPITVAALITSLALAGTACAHGDASPAEASDSTETAWAGAA